MMVFLKSNRNGFTLVEIAIVIILVGLLLIPLVQLYAQYKSQKEINQTTEHMEHIQGLITNFYLSNGRYPCPADPSLSRDDPMFGREINATCDPTLLGTSVALGTCAMGGGICYVTGERDLDTVAGNDPVVIGALPIITIRDVMGSERNVAVAWSLDGWKSQLVYGVTQNQTIASLFVPGNGVIRAENEFNDVTAGINNDADFVLLSRGPNRVAGMGETGQEFESCGTPMTGIENENCDPDAVFVKSLRSTAQGSNYYDDFVIFGKIKTFGLWGPLGGLNNHVRNLNTGFVAVNKDLPEHMLDVSGAIQTDNNVRTRLICTKPPVGDPFDVNKHCFDIRQIEDNTVACPGQSIASINDLSDSNTGAKYSCKAINFINLKPNQACTGFNEWIVGFNSLGEIICKVP